MPNTPGVASRHIIRTALQQLEDAGLVEKFQPKRSKVWTERSNFTPVAELRLLDKSWLTTWPIRSARKKHSTRSGQVLTAGSGERLR